MQVCLKRRNLFCFVAVHKTSKNVLHNLKSLSSNIATIPEISHAGAIYLLFICVYICSHQVVPFFVSAFLIECNNLDGESTAAGPSVN